MVDFTTHHGWLPMVFFFNVIAGYLAIPDDIRDVTKLLNYLNGNGGQNFDPFYFTLPHYSNY